MTGRAPEMSNIQLDDDAISVTSTVDSEHSIDHEFLVDKILAERVNDGQKEYLLSWEGYPEHRSSWEPTEQILNDDLFSRWEECKARQERGEELPYDVSRIDALKTYRQRVRRQKRLKLRQHNRNLGELWGSESSDEATEVRDRPVDQPGIQRPKQLVHPQAQTNRMVKPREFKVQDQNSSSSEDVPLSKRWETSVKRPAAYTGTARPRAQTAVSRKRARAGSNSSSDTPLAVKGARSGQVQPAATGSGSSTISRPTHAGTLRPPPPLTRPLLKDLPRISKFPSAQHSSAIPNTSSVRGSGATRGRGASSLPSRTPRNLIGVWTDPKHKPKVLFNKRLQRKVELQGRALADRSPDIAALGGLFDPSKPDTYRPIKPSEFRKAVINKSTEEGGLDLGLFVPEGEALNHESRSRMKPTPGAFVAPPYQASSRGPPADTSRATCFFWNRARLDPMESDCRNGEHCAFLHGLEYGVPVAPPPDNHVERTRKPGSSSALFEKKLAPRGPSNPSAPAICFFWDRGQRLPGDLGCGKNGRCSYEHSYDGGGSIRPPPRGWIEPRNSVLIDEPNPATNRRERELQRTIFNTASSPSTVSLPSWQQPDRKTCYFWDRHQTDPTESDCRMDSCKFLHFYEDGLPIARPPNQKFSDHREVRRADHLPKPRQYSPDYQQEYHPQSQNYERMTCYSWDRNQKDSSYVPCPMGNDTCEFLHIAGFRISPKPAKQSSLDSTTASEALHTSLSQHASGLTSKTQPLSSHIQPPCDETDPFNALCYDWRDSGSCPVKETCRFLHPNRPEIPFAPKSKAPPLTVVTEAQQKVNISADPIMERCYSFSRDGRCNSRNCKFLHSNDRSIPTAPMAPPSAEICREWLSGVCSRSASSCRYRHENPQSRPTSATIMKDNHPVLQNPRPPAPRKSVSFAPDHDQISYQTEEPPAKSRRTFAISQYKKDNGICNWGDRCKNGSECRFAHDSATEEHVEYSHLSRSRKEGRYLSPPPPGNTTSDGDDDVPMAEYTESPIESSHNIESDVPGSSVRRSNFLDGPRQALQKALQPDLTAPQEQLTKPRTKISVQDYQRSKQPQGNANWVKELVFGTNGEGLSVDLGDFSQFHEEQWAKTFQAVQKLKFDRICIAQDFSAQWPRLQLGFKKLGSMRPVKFSDPTTLRTIERVLDEMSLRSSGLICVCQDLVVLLYRTAPEWEFLGGSNDAFIENKLRFLIIRYDLESIKPIKTKITLNPDGSHTQSLPAPPRKALVKTILGLRLRDLLPVCSSKQNPGNFYFMFPPICELEDFLISWVRSSFDLAKIYSSRKEGSWDALVRDGTVESGVVLIHESVAVEIYRLPSIQELVKRNTTLWCISESSSPYQMYPSTQYFPDETKLGRITATRLFPHGHVFLLMPSFIIAEPQKTLELLDWFFGKPVTQAAGGSAEVPWRYGKLASATQGTWKLVACHNLSNYTLDLANSKAAEKKAFELENRDEPSIEQILEDKGLDFLTCKLRYNVHAKLVEVESRNLLKTADELDSGFADAHYNPVVYADRSIDPDDEKALLEWFALWSLRKLDMYRKFTVIGTDSRSAKRATRLKEFEIAGSHPTLNSSAPINQQSAVEPAPPKNPADKAKEVAATLNALNAPSKALGTERHDPDYLEAQVLELIETSRLEAAKSPTSGSASSSRPSSSASNSGVSFSLRPTGNPRRQSPIKPGFTRLEDRAASRRNQVVDGTPTNDISATPSNAASPMEIGSVPMSKTNSLSSFGWQAQDSKNVELREIKFEPTEIWYRKMKEAGNGFEHLFVGNAEKAFHNLGIAKK